MQAYTKCSFFYLKNQIMKIRFFFFVSLFWANLPFSNAQSWSTTEITQGRMRFSAVANGEKMIIAGGFTGPSNGVSKVVNIYDATTKTWSVKQLATGRALMAAVAVGDKIILGCGAKQGLISTNIFDMYDVKTGEWTTFTHGQNRQYLGGAAVGTKAYFMGGFLNPGQTNVVEIYDVLTGVWSLGTPVPFKFEGSTLVAYGTKIMAQGPSKIGIYDTVTDTWETTDAPMPLFGTMPILTDSEIWLIGGFHNSTYIATNQILVYNIANKTWSDKKLSFARGSGMVGYIGGRIIIVGGAADVVATISPLTDWVEIFDTKTGMWEQEIIKTSEPHGFMSEPFIAPRIGAVLFFPSGDKVGYFTATRVVEVYTDTILAASSSVFLQHLPEASLEVGQQPFNDFLDLKSHFPNDLDGRLQIYGSDGHLILECKIEKGQLEKTNIDTTNWPAGSYFLGVISKKGSLSKKMVKAE
jgi:hypothetical protein